ncbi:MAG: T9SS type A sorting domain-containing protein [Bacteroidetes bacterium]|nr:T9SS type A sorting domain-containing protein [Rhodothermia bacterium]MCS7155449.1 T9SS type A sorting domain-containing protein [Bacteroidota bacterium]MCX7907458.1 T9SS type A sorting domain-containing protein [Bacteroidota bacterium]MDW8138452.1 T9SS type A sorting domain-containing protein [Bacteroidota bacterium]MDW8284611.1 T9SS type A sorting domain-containing protein [Bacteroidota bacterium]
MRWVGLTFLFAGMLSSWAEAQESTLRLPSGDAEPPVICVSPWLNEQAEARAALAEFRTLAQQRDELLRSLRRTAELVRSSDPRRAAQLEAAWAQGLPLPGMQSLPVSVGQNRTFKVYNFQTRIYDNVSFTLRGLGDLAEVWVADDQWGEGKINESVVQAILRALERETPPGSYDPGRGILAIEQEVFGQPPNVDGSGKLKVLLLDIQDGWSEGSNAGYVAGFFNGVDLSPTNPNSNRADILYVDTYPGIFRQNRPPDPNRPLNTVAHEYQHLIHARYGQLNTFQNEGQSEWAEILCGFSGRAISYLNQPAEVNIFLYNWRSGDLTNVLRDYERAGLFHTYIADRIGALLAGQITRGPTGRAGYQAALNQAGLLFEDLLAEFHVANWVNDPSIEARWGYRTPQRRGLRATTPAVEHLGSSGVSASRSGTLQYGGAEYVRFFGVSNLQLALTLDDGTRAFAVTRAPSGAVRVHALSSGPHTFTGSYESVVLVVANVRPVGPSENAPGQRTYQYAATWQPLQVRAEVLSYAGSAQYYTELPGDPRDPNRAGILAYAYRFTPTLTGYVEQLRFPLNGRDSSLMGSGRLRLVLTTSRLAQGTGALEAWVPDRGVDSLEVPFSSLQRGVENVISLAGRPWSVQAGQHYHVVLRLAEASSNARLEFLLDGGSTNQSDPRYWPPRTRLYVVPPTVASPGWYRYTNSNNLLMSVRIVERIPTAIAEEAPTPDRLLLEAVYPHPVNGRAWVRYQTPRAGPVRLELYDVLGRRVRVLLETTTPAGAHEVSFSAAGLSAGLYWLLLSDGQSRQTRPVVVLP